MPQGKKKAGKRRNRKRYSMPEPAFFALLIDAVVDEECKYWEDFHTRVKQLFDYQRATDADGELVTDEDGDWIFLNPENEAAELTLQSLKARTTRVRKKFMATPDEKGAANTFDLFETKPKPGKPAPVPPDWEAAREKLRKAGKLNPVSAPSETP